MSAIRKLLMRAAMWDDDRNEVLVEDVEEYNRIRREPTIEDEIKVEKALALLRYVREILA